MVGPDATSTQASRKHVCHVVDFRASSRCSKELEGHLFKRARLKVFSPSRHSSSLSALYDATGDELHRVVSFLRSVNEMSIARHRCVLNS